MLNCIDRLILELRLPPADAYHKIRSVLDNLNAVVRSATAMVGGSEQRALHPLAGNVIFGATKFALLFDLSSFAEIYIKR